MRKRTKRRGRETGVRGAREEGETMVETSVGEHRTYEYLSEESTV